MTRLLLSLALLAPLTAAAAANANRFVAVFPLSVQGQLDPAEKQSFDEQVRTEAARHLPSGGLLVLTSETQLRLLEDNGLSVEQIAQACEKSCPLDAAKELKVRVFVTGQISRTSEGFAAFVRINDGDTGAILASSEILEGRTMRELRGALSVAASDFFRRAATQLGGGAKLAGAGELELVPQLAGKLKPGGALDFSINPDAIVAYDVALQAEAHGQQAPEEAARAWDELSRIGGKNPYREGSGERVKQWREFAARKAAKDAKRAAEEEAFRRVVASAAAAGAKSLAFEEFRAAQGDLAAARALTSMEPRELRGKLCAGLDASSAVARDVKLVTSDGQTPQGAFVLRADGAEVGPVPGVIQLKPCVDSVVVYDAWTRKETAVELPADAALTLTVPRFLPDAGRTTDRVAGLIWLAAPPGEHEWDDAFEVCASLTLERGGWRLPSVAETRLLAEGGSPHSIMRGTIWTSTEASGDHETATSTSNSRTVSSGARYDSTEAAAVCVKPLDPSVKPPVREVRPFGSGLLLRGYFPLVNITYIHDDVQLPGTLEENFLWNAGIGVTLYGGALARFVGPRLRYLNLPDHAFDPYFRAAMVIRGTAEIGGLLELGLVTHLLSAGKDVRWLNIDAGLAGRYDYDGTNAVGMVSVIMMFGFAGLSFDMHTRLLGEKAFDVYVGGSLVFAEAAD